MELKSHNPLFSFYLLGEITPIFFVRSDPQQYQSLYFICDDDDNDYNNDTHYSDDDDDDDDGSEGGFEFTFWSMLN